VSGCSIASRSIETVMKNLSVWILFGIVVASATTAAQGRGNVPMPTSTAFRRA